MNSLMILFYIFLVTAGISAASILFIRNIFKGALLLLVCLLSLAALYVLTFAEFVAITQIMVYAGGILVVIIFGVMLTSKTSGRALITGNANLFSGLLIAAALLGLLIPFFYTRFSIPYHTTRPNAFNTVTETGLQLMSTFVLPFEVAGLLLLIALIGAAVIASSIKSKKSR
jgi:NADH:ubiquinone oxidoreductase subunit 6 (subunit J)